MELLVPLLRLRALARAALRVGSRRASPCVPREAERAAAAADEGVDEPPPLLALLLFVEDATFSVSASFADAVPSEAAASAVPLSLMLLLPAAPRPLPIRRAAAPLPSPPPLASSSSPLSARRLLTATCSACSAATIR